MIRAQLGEERDGPSENAGRHHGKWHWTCPEHGVEGYSRQPLLDACREIKRMGGDTADIVGLFREARSVPDAIVCVGWGADHTVDETTTRFAKWRPYPMVMVRLTGGQNKEVAE